MQWSRGLHRNEMLQLVIVESLTNITLASYMSLTKGSAMTLSFIRLHVTCV